MNNSASMTLPATLQLEQIRCYAYHGVLPQERQVGAWYTVDVTLHVQLDATPLLHDDLAGTLNYAEAFACVQRTMAQPCLLIERAAFAIAEALLHQMNGIIAVDIRLRKDTPPMGGHLAGASVAFTLTREQYNSFVS